MDFDKPKITTVPLFLTHQSETIEWSIWEITESLDAFLSDDLELEIIDQVAQIKSEKRKKEFLLARLLLKQMFGKTIRVSYDAFGAPFIEESDWNISITHSGSFVAVARSKKALGIDVELISQKLERTKHKFSSDKELSQIDSSQNLFHLALSWSAKESVYKMVGSEALIFDRQMQIQAFTPKAKGDFTIKLDAIKLKADVKVNYSKHGDYVFTFCVLE